MNYLTIYKSNNSYYLGSSTTCSDYIFNDYSNNIIKYKPNISYYIDTINLVLSTNFNPSMNEEESNILRKLLNDS